MSRTPGGNIDRKERIFMVESSVIVKSVLRGVGR